MSKLTEQLRSLGIYNPHIFAGIGNVLIHYTPADNGRGGSAAKWVVARPGFATDPKASWYDYGNKTFVVIGRENKNVKLDEAKRWASAKYGIKDWARTPYGSWMDAGFVKKRLAELTDQLKQPKEVA